MTHKPSFMQFFGRTLTVSGLALLCFSTVAEAGFEWRGPIEPPVRKAAPAPVQNNVGHHDLTGLEPVISWDGTKPAHAAVAAPAVPVESAPVAPVSPALAPFAAAPAPATVTTMPIENADIAVGFGRDLPLVIALQQVAPAGHQFSFASGVNPGTPVSWEGGKAWTAVMDDMLAPHGLGFQQQGNVIVVGAFNTQEAVLSPAAAAAAARMSAPPEDYDAAPVAVETPVESAPAPAADPVTIRRDRGASAAPAAKPAAAAPAVVKSEEAAPVAPAVDVAATPAAPVDVAPVAVAPAVAAPVVVAPVAAAHAVDTRTAGTQPVVAAPAPKVEEQRMSYKPETSSTRPVPVTSLPPSATKELSSPPQLSPAPETVVAAAAPVAKTAAVEKKAEKQAEKKTDAPVSLIAAPAAEEVKAVEAKPVAADTKADVAKTTGPWAGAKGATLRDTLKNWSDDASVELYWSIDYDYKLKGDISYAGSYDEAVGKLLDQFAAVRPQPYGQLHQSKDGPRVLVVKSYDATP